MTFVLDARPGRANPQYPRWRAGLPAFQAQRPPHRVRFARSEAELEAAQRLRFRVFNEELGEGLAASRSTGLDADAFDGTSHHLLVSDERSGEIVGTYRLSTLELASGAEGFYAAQEFDLSRLPHAALAASVELGRACIAPEHRGGHVLALLFQGIAAYAAANRKRYLFGCASLPGSAAPAAAALTRALAAAGHIDDALDVPPHPGFEPTGCGDRGPDAPPPALPPLVRRYLRLGARLAPRPAHDRAFGTLDYFTWLDVERSVALRVLGAPAGGAAG